MPRTENIGASVRRRRLMQGLAGFAVAVALVVVLSVIDVERWWRLVAFLPFWGGALGVLQAQAST